MTAVKSLLRPRHTRSHTCRACGLTFALPALAIPMSRCLAHTSPSKAQRERLSKFFLVLQVGHTQDGATTPLVSLRCQLDISCFLSSQTDTQAIQSYSCSLMNSPNVTTAWSPSRDRKYPEHALQRQQQVLRAPGWVAARTRHLPGQQLFPSQLGLTQFAATSTPRVNTTKFQITNPNHKPFLGDS